MFKKKRICLLSVGVVSVISKYVNHHSSCSTCTAAENFNITNNYVQKWLYYYGTRKIRTSQFSESSNSNNGVGTSSSYSTDPTSAANLDSPTVSATPCSPSEPIILSNLTLHEIHTHLANIRKSFINKEQINNEAFIFKDVNISELFSKYQHSISNIIEKHKCLPIESYIHELASLTHIFFLCKNQKSEIAERIFTLDLLKELAIIADVGTTGSSFCLTSEDFITANTAINDLSLGKKTREMVTLDIHTLASKISYGPKWLLMGSVNLINKLPNTPLNDYKQLSETELWSTYFDPVLSYLVSDPDRLIHLSWTDVLPNESGNSRPDAVISEKQQLSFGSSVGFGEAKIQQGSCSKLLCLDTLRLAIFTKNAIDINKLEGILAFQIHGFNASNLLYIVYLYSQLVNIFICISSQAARCTCFMFDTINKK